MEIRPAFYDAFSCLARDCRHSCCRGWEIDVDREALGRYLALEGPLGDELRSSLQETEGTWSFRLRENGDCPFLRPDGLCRLILVLGEDSLCDICALHPRFYQDVGAHELAGLGLCCEAVTDLLLDFRGELLFLTEDDEPLTLDRLLRLLGRDLSPGELHFSPKTDGAYYQTVFRRYGQCEAINTAWTRDLAALAADPETLAAQAEAYARRYDRGAFDRVFAYILYRQLEFLERYGLPVLLRYAREATDFIFLRAAATGDLPESVRRWSEEMEYSTENIDFLLQSHSEEMP